MNKEELIRKWLSDEGLTSSEQEAFEQLEDYSELMKLDVNMKRFTPETYNSKKELESILEKIKPKKKTKFNTSFFMKVAASIVFIFGCYYLYSDYKKPIENIVFETQDSDLQEIILPDASIVILNTNSKLGYNPKTWKDNRNLNLNGEAYFKVSKGEKFTVNTKNGSITVLGTHFNVKNINHNFEVVCYEGSVEVQYKDLKKILKPNDQFIVSQNSKVKYEKDVKTEPSWLHHKSTFKSQPLKNVLAEFEKTYHLTVQTNKLNLEELFTGSFTHKDKNLAIKSITIPLEIHYALKNDSLLVLEK